jgi:hypothetical protein
MMPRAEYSQVMRASFDDQGRRRPKATDPFTAEQISGYSDGDYPAWLQQEMEDILPHQLLQRFGTRMDTALNGTFWMIPSDLAEQAIRAVEQLGFEVKSGQRLNFW